jgi:hypothetical protein
MMWCMVLWTVAAWATNPDALLADLKRWQPLRSSTTAPDIPRHVYQAALDGEITSGIEIVEDIKAAKAYGVAVFDIPIETFWKAIADEDHHANALPITRSMTIDGRRRSPDHTIFQYMDIPILSDRWWVVRIQYNGGLYTASKHRAWELVWEDRLKEPAMRSKIAPALIADGMPIAWTKGAWLLVDLGQGRTLVEYHTWSDPGGSVPPGPASRFAAGEVKSNLRSIRTFAKNHTPTCSGTYVRPDGSAL